MQCKHCKPELIMTLQNNHDPVTLLDTESPEIVGALRRSPLHIPEGETSFGHIIGDMNHCQFVRFLLGNCIHDIKSEIEAVFIYIIDFCQLAVFIFLCLNKAITDKLFLCCTGRNKCVADLCFLCIIARNDNCHKQTVSFINRNHAMRCRAVVVNTVTLTQIFDIVTHLDFHSSADDKVKFLSCMLG